MLNTCKTIATEGQKTHREARLKPTGRFKLELYTCLQVTYLWVDPFEGRVILVHLKVDFSGGDGQSPPSHQDRGNKLGRAAQDHWACRVQRGWPHAQ